MQNPDYKLKYKTIMSFSYRMECKPLSYSPTFSMSVMRIYSVIAMLGVYTRWLLMDHVFLPRYDSDFPY